MTGYIPINEACVRAGISVYMLNKYVSEGKIRVKDTTDMTKKGRAKVRYVSYQDILDAQNGLELDYVGIKQVDSMFGIASRVVRYQVENHRLRWRRNGTNLQVCVSDLELYASGSMPESAARSKATLSQAATQI